MVRVYGVSPKSVHELVLALKLIASLGLCLIIAACAGSPSGNVATAPGTYKIGSPYKVNGIRYVPREDANYRATGIASWYGKKFHGRRTANGEIFDMNGLTAAHPTLPLPSKVRVTNLENGKQIELRVNDRGPFTRGRIIDVSKRAAKLLGFQGKGTAKVRVEYVGRAPLEVFVAGKPETTRDERYAAAAAPTTRVVKARISPPPGAQAAPPAESMTATSSIIDRRVGPQTKPVTWVPISEHVSIYVQAGLFADPSNASRLRASLEPLAPVNVRAEMIDSKQHYRVRLGPFEKVEEADTILEVLARRGHGDAHIVIE
ncbi:MAG: septal ring lytic transglycosylase RlpA family protein [Alphaproteobacteria bacterium]|nr:MAG: septal ring lytic transglycosylase RlpA family protein [Alphaproteobacteria bacterium]